MNDRLSYSSTKSSSSTGTKHPRKSSSTSSSKLANPIDIPSHRANSSSYTNTGKDLPLSTSPTQMSPSSPSSPTPHHSSWGKRTSSSSYTTSHTHAHPHPHSYSYPHRPNHQHKRSSDDYRRYSGTVNHCGRHSNDWLFGGFSVRDTVRDGVDRWRQHRYEHHLQQEHQQELEQQELERGREEERFH